MRTILCVILVALAGCGKIAPTTESGPAVVKGAPSERLTQEAARAKAMGKTKAQIKDLFGKPDATFDFDSGNSLWEYHASVWNPNTEALDKLLLNFDAAGVCVKAK